MSIDWNVGSTLVVRRAEGAPVLFEAPLREAVQEWRQLSPEERARASLTTDGEIELNRHKSSYTLIGNAIGKLSSELPD